MRKSFYVEIEEFAKKSSFWKEMAATCENSPWHREESVAEHTRMVLRWYDDNCASGRSQRAQFLTKLALLFHDFGKPKTRTEKHSEARGTYFAYPGHEKISARLFEDFFMTNRDKLAGFNMMLWSDFRIVKFLIETHLPYDYVKMDKLIALKKDLLSQGLETVQMFFDMLRSDAHGRISDDAESKYARLEEWIQMFSNVEIPQESPIDHINQPYLNLLIGPAGVGKSTFCEDLKSQGVEFTQFGLDLCRLSFFKTRTGNDGLADECFEYAIEHSKEFDKHVNSEYSKLLKSKVNIVLDNTNTTMKSRRKWIVAARQQGYYVATTEFPISLAVVKDRQKDRGAKSVPLSVVESQYFNIATPWIGSETDVSIICGPDKQCYKLSN